MVIEAAVGETRELHQVDNTEPFRALLAQTVGGIFNDPIVGLTPVVFYVSHCHSVQGPNVIGCTTRLHPLEAILEPRFLESSRQHFIAMPAILYDYRHITTSINRRVRHGRGFRSRRHRCRRPYAARPLPGRAVALAPTLSALTPSARRSSVPACGGRIDEVLMGCVLPAGQGQAPARQAARGAGLPDATGATTINKVCGSGMKATMLAHDLIRAGSAEIVVAGGMESMRNAPYLLDKARGGYRAGHDRIFDHMMLDGLEDAYETGRSMGDFGEATAEPTNSPAPSRTPTRSRH